ncbi:Uncharacterised protein [Mycobacteroides abscessus]|nr:Uncharacterised protein [Mycobacteroides abscessus]
MSKKKKINQNNQPKSIRQALMKLSLAVNSSIHIIRLKHLSLDQVIDSLMLQVLQWQKHQLKRIIHYLFMVVLV